MSFTLADLEARLAALPPRTPSILDGIGKRAAVAVVLRAVEGRPEVLLMKRRDRDGDRWSGHVSFPGGMEHPGDGELRATAIRETLEEVGLDLLRSARWVAELDPQRAVAQGRVLPLTITPHVFVTTEDAPVTPREEAEAVFWLPLDEAGAGRLDGTFTYELGPLPISLPCFRFAGFIVWGLTYQMLRRVLSLVLNL